ncbi:MAG TPA: DUF3108 domain-containing protein [Thermoanaerobaculia bacterium]|nr:DUF3108 domain-containing protein [Thermoanaerobaculia bacterium]
MSFLLAAVVAASTAFSQGETLDYNLTWMRISGGTARMTIAPMGEDRFRITSVAKSSRSVSRIYRVNDSIECIVDRGDFSTLEYTKKIDERDQKKTEVTTVENGVATRVRYKVKKVAVPRPVYDPISIIYHVRTLDLAPGKSHDFKIISDGKLYDVRARVVKRETLQTPAGTFATVMVEPEMKTVGQERDERMFIWYSDDQRRIPVRIRTEVKFGAVTATLRAISSGVRSIDPPVLRGDVK